MNTNHQPVVSNQNTIKTNRQNPMPNPANPNHRPMPVRPKNYSVIFLIQLLLLITAVAAAALFMSFIPIKFVYDYRETVKPVTGATAANASPSDGVSEVDIPVPPKVPEVLPDYDFSQPVPEGATYPVSYFDDTVFIGDSRTAGLIMYTKLSPHNYSSVGLNIAIISTKNYIRYTEEDGSKRDVTCMQALELEKGKYKSIYLALGLNELGWDANSYIKTYRKAIDEIRTITDVPIYIQLIIPVTADASEKSTFGITNAKADEFNTKLMALGEELHLFVIDPTDLFALEDGTLNPEDSFDGVHLTSAAYKELLEFYQRHAVNPELYENLRTPEEPADDAAVTDTPN